MAGVDQNVSSVTGFKAGTVVPESAVWNETDEVCERALLFLKRSQSLPV